jgi:hypothetical protein
VTLTANVAAGQTAMDTWGNEIRDRSCQVFASAAERDQWAAPIGALAAVVTGSEAVLYQRRNNAWQQLHVSALTVDGAIVAAGALQGTQLAVTLVNGNGSAGVTVQHAAVSISSNAANKAWNTAQCIANGEGGSGTGGRVCVITSAAPGWQIGAFAATTPYLLDHNGTTLGTINYTPPCSARLKVDIADVGAGVLERIRRLRVRRFRRKGAAAYIDDAGVEVVPEQPPGRLEVGLVAEETDALPDLLIDDPVAATDVGPLLDQQGLVFWLLAAVQELADKVDALASP